MKKICLSVVGIFLLFVHSFSQSIPKEDEAFKSRKLSLEETNIVSSYYQQTGNHSAVTGGIGTQKLNDISNQISLKFVKTSLLNKKQSLDVDFAIDHHTAASSAYVSKTGASRTGGTRVYPSFTWTTENEEKHTSFGAGASFSAEYNYHSYGAHAQFTKQSANENTQLAIGSQVFLDRVKLIQPSEFNTASVATTTPTVTTYTTASGRTIRSSGSSYSKASSSDIPTSPRNTLAASLTLSQVVNKRMQVALLTDVATQQGYLGLPFHRVYTTDGKVHIENLPSSRTKVPVGLRLNYFAGDHVVLRGYYRYYMDTWGIKANTASLETVFKVSPFVSVSPFYRYYQQSAANYFAPYGQHSPTDKYFTSNYDYSAFSSGTVGVNLRISPQNGILGMQKFSLIEIRYANYEQTTGLKGNNITVNFRFK